ncbi:28S ribosomal protein S21, mitochondrial isoform X1 [Aquila chrysaetos chrysaetos]|uniref:28S ribosomal protein S21, mitochondrial isoform X1 n=1 Tax=Aquila chrysaetos chrysaetos TaxID=223781 RepID=UPI00117718CB|nr:28S ribosomal protein S21, mitochondrial isoform X1 [Aquila chrysaetos chrysaetos]
MSERGGRGPAGGTCGRARVRVGAAAAGAEPAPAPGRGHRDSDTGTGTETPGQGQRHRDGDTGTGTGTPAPGQLQPGAGSLTQAAPQELNPARGSSGGAPPCPPPPWTPPPVPALAALPPPARVTPPLTAKPRPVAPPPTPPKTEWSRKRPGGPDRAPPELSSSPRGGKRPRKGDGGDSPPSDGDRLFAQKCQELRGFIRPLAELLEGLKRGRYDRGLSSFQQSVAMDRIQRIIGVLQKPEMGARYLGTLLQVEGMLRVWFPHVAPKPAQDPAPSPAAATPPRRRPPAGPPRSTPLSTSAWGRPPFQPHGDVGDITSRGAPQVPDRDPRVPHGAGCVTPPQAGEGVSWISRVLPFFLDVFFFLFVFF